MAKKCPDCGHENDDSSLRCVCGRELAVAAPTAPAPETAPTTLPTRRKLAVFKIVFVLWALGLVPLYAALRTHLHVTPFHRSLIGTGVLTLSALVAFWLFGKERRRTVRAWRAVFMLRALYLVPLVLVIADGLAEYGWPSGRHNRPIAHVVTLCLVLVVPTFLTGLFALIRTPRVASVLALLTGIATVVDGVLFIRATEPFRHRWRPMVDVLDVVMCATTIETYAAIPLGLAFAAGGVLTLRAARRPA